MTDEFKAQLIELLNDNLGGVQAYLTRRPQNSALPAVVVSIVSRMPEYADDGEAGLAITRAQVDTYALTATAATDLAVLVTSVLSAYSGDDDLGSPNNSTLVFFELVGERDLSETGSNSAEYLFRISQDYRVVERREI